MASSPDPQPTPETSSESVPPHSGTNFSGGTPAIHFNSQYAEGDTAFHMNKNIYLLGEQPSDSSANDVCQALKAMLQGKYKKIRIPKMPWIDYNYEFPLEHYFVDLTVIEKGDTMGRKPGKETKLQNIFNPVARKSSTRILIEGPAGYGKSTLALKLCHDYAKEEDYISQFQLVVLIRLREFKASTVDEMLTKTLKINYYSSELILKSMRKNEKSTCIILDGYDEADQKSRDHLNLVFNSESLPEATVIVTTRPGAVDNIDDFDKRIEIKGVTGANRCQFLKIHLESCSEEQTIFLKHFLKTNFGVTFNEGKVRRVLRKLLKTLSIIQEKENLFDSPLFLLLVVAVAKNSYPNITTFTSKTELYKKLFNFVAQRTLEERVQLQQSVDVFEFDVDNPPSYATSLSQFGKLAIKALTTKQFSFTEEEILSSCGGDDIVLQMGLLTGNDIIDDTAGLQHSSYQPIHLSILEFSAAYHFWYSFKRFLSSFDFPREFLPDLSGNIELFVFQFFIGLLGHELKTFFSAVKDEFPQDLFLRLARCKAISTDQTLMCYLHEALIPLAPKVWRTSYFKHGGEKLSELIIDIVQDKIDFDCIVHDADLDSDFIWKTKKVRLIWIKKLNNRKALQRAYRNVNFPEVRLYFSSNHSIVKYLKDIDSSIELITLVLEDVSKFEKEQVMYNLHDSIVTYLTIVRHIRVVCLQPTTPHELKVLDDMRDEIPNGMTIGVYESVLDKL